jgi:hypothetical protein
MIWIGAMIDDNEIEGMKLEIETIVLVVRVVTDGQGVVNDEQAARPITCGQVRAARVRYPQTRLHTGNVGG